MLHRWKPGGRLRVPLGLSGDCHPLLPSSVFHEWAGAVSPGFLWPHLYESQGTMLPLQADGQCISLVSNMEAGFLVSFIPYTSVSNLPHFKNVSECLLEKEVPSLHRDSEDVGDDGSRAFVFSHYVLGRFRKRFHRLFPWQMRSGLGCSLLVIICHLTCKSHFPENMTKLFPWQGIEFGAMLKSLHFSPCVTKHKIPEFLLKKLRPLRDWLSGLPWKALEPEFEGRASDSKSTLTPAMRPLPWALATQSVPGRFASSASPGSLFKIQNLKHALELLSQNLPFNKISRLFSPFPPTSLGYNSYITMSQFNAYSVMIWHKYVLQNVHHNKVG